MSSSKNRQVNKVNWSTPPPTQATTALQGMVDQGADYTTPIRNAYARAEQGLSHSYQNPLGAYTTADVRDKSLRQQNTNLNQQMGMDLATAAQENAQGRFNRQATVAGLTAPQMYNSESRQAFTAGDYLGMAFGGGSAALS